MRYFFEIAYKGRAFHGWQRQPNAVSVQESIETAISTILREEISITGCGRTDTGVHARQFYFHLDLPQGAPENLIHRLNAFSNQDIAYYRMIPVKDTAHARFDAGSRKYIYHVHFSKSPFINELSYFHPHGKPDATAMDEAARSMFDFEDFATFCKTGTDAKTTICKIMDSHWERSGDHWRYHIRADRFLRGMVRLVTGALFEVGMGKLSLDDFRRTIAAGERFERNISMPAEGLFLEEVTYPYISGDRFSPQGTQNEAKSELNPA